MRRRPGDGLVAGAVAAVVSGAPSAAHALATGRDPLETTLAAGSILLPRETRRDRLVLAAAPVHLALSLLWGVALSRLLPRRPGLLHGAVAGVAVYALDMGVVARVFPRVRALPQLPQALDHVLYGVTVAAVLRRYRSGRGRARSSGRP